MADILDAFGRELAQATLRGPRARESWKAVLSVLLGLGLALLLFESNDAYWAAFSAFMILKASVAETITRGVYRVLGTIGGALTGFVIAGFLGNSASALLLAMMSVAFVSIFRFQTSKYSYAWMYFGLTGEIVLSITLGSPFAVTTWVAIRVGEIAAGVAGCIFVSCMFSVLWPADTDKSPAPTAPDGERLPLWRGLFDEEWLEENWLPLIHAARGAFSFAVLFFFWRLIELDDITDSASTSILVLMLPGAPVRQGKNLALIQRGMQRFVGCSLGGLFGIAALLSMSDNFQIWALMLAIGVWIAAWVQNGKEGASYAGSQFALVLFVTLIQGNGPPADLQPTWQRFRGILIGIFILSLVNAAWPLPGPEALGEKTPSPS